MKRRVRVFTMVAISFGMAFAAQAEPPELMSHQGLLTTAAGTVVPDGGYDLRFRICTGPVGENCTWQQELSVQVQNGVYSVLLSAMGLADQFQQPITYLEVAITSAPPEAGIGTLPLVMAPRQQIASVPFAFSAGHADTATQATTNATTDSPGVVRLATYADAAEGTDNSRALVPANLGSNYNDTPTAGYVELMGTGLLLQWTSGAVYNGQMLTFATQFANTDYVLAFASGSKIDDGESWWLTKETTTQVMWHYEGGVPCTISIIAIGAKPVP